jgi:NTE family protein
MQTLREWLRERPYTLGLSSGFFGFFAHCGALSVLEEEGLHPVALSGSSAGALVGGLWAGGVSAAGIREALFRVKREDFWDPAPGLGLLRGEKFAALLRDLLPARLFSECRAPLSVSVFDLLRRETRVLREGPLAPAIQASCTFPFLFQPRWDKGRPLIDGGVLDRPGLLGVPAGARTLHHHLASRSPWRRAQSAALDLPRRENLASLVIERLPRVGPFRLAEGVRAYHIARDATSQALDRPLQQGAVFVPGGD